jgi:aspartyl-tRNA(Asn)/glutamyl-tRNA(Gln) amidotransferase subunit B
MPDPDLGILHIDKPLLEYLHRTLPLNNDQVATRLVSEHGLTLNDAKALIAFGDDRDEYFENVVAYLGHYGHKNTGRIAGNWVLHDLGRLLKQFDLTWDENPVDAARLGDVLDLLLSKQIAASTARHLLALPFDGDSRPSRSVVKEDRLELVPIDAEELQDIVQSVIADNAEVVQQVREGKTARIFWLVGQAMQRAGDGKADARSVDQAMRDALK